MKLPPLHKAVAGFNRRDKFFGKRKKVMKYRLMIVFVLTGFVIYGYGEEAKQSEYAVTCTLENQEIEQGLPLIAYIECSKGIILKKIQR